MATCREYPGEQPEAKRIQKDDHLISEEYIKSLKTQVDTNFQSWRIQDFLRLNKNYYQGVYLSDNTSSSRSLNKGLFGDSFNIFKLILPSVVCDIKKMYDYCQGGHYSGTVCMRPHLPDVFEFHVQVIKSINLVYIDFLKAINDGGITSLKANFSETSAITFHYRCDNSEHIQFAGKKVTLPPAMLAYLMLNIVFGINEQINHKARYRALQLINNHFNVTKLAAAFREHEGYEAFGQAPMLILPPAFQPDTHIFQPDYQTLKLNRESFFTNSVIKEIIHLTQSPAQIGNVIRKKINYDATVATLISRYPHHYLQVLNALLLLSNDRGLDSNYHQGEREVYLIYDHIEQIFLLLFSALQLDEIQQQEIYGEQASYHDLHKYIGNNFALGFKSYDTVKDEDLLQLSAEILVRRIRQLERSSKEPMLAARLREVEGERDKNQEEKMKLNTEIAALKLSLAAKDKQLQSTQQELRRVSDFMRARNINPQASGGDQVDMLRCNCQILGVDIDLFMMIANRSADDANTMLKQHWKTLTLYAHPDKNVEANDKKLATEKMQKFNQAKEYLEAEVQRIQAAKCQRKPGY